MTLTLKDLDLKEEDFLSPGPPHMQLTLADFIDYDPSSTSPFSSSTSLKGLSQGGGGAVNTTSVSSNSNRRKRVATVSIQEANSTTTADKAAGATHRHADEEYHEGQDDCCLTSPIGQSSRKAKSRQQATTIVAPVASQQQSAKALGLGAGVVTAIGRAFETFLIAPGTLEPEDLEEYVDVKAICEFLPAQWKAARRQVPKAATSSSYYRRKSLSHNASFSGISFANITPASTAVGVGGDSGNSLTHHSRFLHIPSENQHWAIPSIWQDYLHRSTEGSSLKKMAALTSAVQQAFEDPEGVQPQVAQLYASTPALYSTEVLTPMRELIIEKGKRTRSTSLYSVSLLQLQSHGFSTEKGGILLDGKQKSGSPIAKFGSPTDAVVLEEERSGAFDDSKSVDSGVEKQSDSVKNQKQSLVASMKHHRYVLKRTEEYWIGLKGFVFLIKTDLPHGLGRALYYRTYLAPIYSGRECTECFAKMCNGYNKDDFLYHAQKHKNKEKVLRQIGEKEEDHDTDHQDDPHQRIREKEEADAKKWSSKYAPVGSVFSVPLTPQQKQHVNNIFSLFLQDFEMIGLLEKAEQYWF